LPKRAIEITQTDLAEFRAAPAEARVFEIKVNAHHDPFSPESLQGTKSIIVIPSLVDGCQNRRRDWNVHTDQTGQNCHR
jgi:hypothetical protein